MKEKQIKIYEELAQQLVTPERFSKATPAAIAEPLFEYDPDLPKAAIYYFPERTAPEDIVA